MGIPIELMFFCGSFVAPMNRVLSPHWKCYLVPLFSWIEYITNKWYLDSQWNQIDLSNVNYELGILLTFMQYNVMFLLLSNFNDDLVSSIKACSCVSPLKFIIPLQPLCNQINKRIFLSFVYCKTTGSCFIVTIFLIDISGTYWFIY